MSPFAMLWYHNTSVQKYNLHGHYFINYSKTTPSPSSCTNDSFLLQIYSYHGSIGYYSYYEMGVGSYCAKDNVAYIVMQILGTFDMNGAHLADDTGSSKSRISYWYGIVGLVWLLYRVLVIRRSVICCRLYGQKCAEMEENLHLQEVMVFVQESMHLSAHGAANYQRIVLLYLIMEGIMTDLFLVIASDGWVTRVQYVSLGYNLSGLLLLLFEMVESTKLLKEKWRLRFKRVFFSYEATFVGEVVTAFALQTCLSGLNKSDLKHSKPIALAVSYYFWGLLCHGIVVPMVIAIILSVRIPWSMMYVWLKHRSLAILCKPCCVDTTLEVRNRIILLGGYHLEDDKLYFELSALKAFGMMKMKQDNTECLVMHKLHWFTVSRKKLTVVGEITGDRVESSNERRSIGIVSFLDRKLGGASSQSDLCRHKPSRVVSWPDADDGFRSSPAPSLFSSPLTV